MILAFAGDRAQVDAYLRTNDGQRIARQIARAIFEDEERLTAFELGDGNLPPSVEYELSKLISARNANADRASDDFTHTGVIA